MRFRLITVLLVSLTVLVGVMSGCADNTQDIDGLYIVTFEVNGGVLDIKTSNVSDRINFAYEPGSYILDPSSYNGYTIRRNDYNFTGWYKDAECTPESKWDFSRDTVDSEKITLYAGWEKKIAYSFSVCYTEGGETTVIGTYKNVEKGGKFEDYREYASSRDGYTSLGYFSDPECTKEWDPENVHPGGDADTDIPVYVKYIEGDWKLVGTGKELMDALRSGEDIYLMCNIDCKGIEFPSKPDYDGIFSGNGYTVSDITVNKAGTALSPSVSLFGILGGKAEIKNVYFENVTYEFDSISDKAKKFKVAALALDCESGCKIENVKITGVINVSDDIELPRLNCAIYSEEGEGMLSVNGFDCTITVVNK